MERIISYLLLIAGIFMACEPNETSENISTDKPNNSFANSYPYSKIELQENITSDAQTVTNTQTFIFQDSLLTKYTTAQHFQAVEPVEIIHTTTLEYDMEKVVVTDAFGNTSTYILNENGYATSCLRQESGNSTRYYTFAYTATPEGRQCLSQVTETINDDSQPYSTINIDYQV